MTLFDILLLNKELLYKLNKLGISTSDYLLADIYKDYLAGKRKGLKVTYLTIIIANKYGISQRSVYSAIQKMKTPINRIVD